MICHDALFMAQLQSDIARKYGTESRVININDHVFLIFSVINIDGHVMCCADLVFMDMPYGLGVARHLRKESLHFHVREKDIPGATPRPYGMSMNTKSAQHIT